MTAVDHRMIAIVLHLSMAQASVDPAILLLFDTVVGICEFLYLPQEKWTPFFKCTSELGYITS